LFLNVVKKNKTKQTKIYLNDIKLKAFKL